MNITDQLQLQNPWWTNPNYQPAEARLSKRELFSQLLHDTTNIKQMVSLTGMRRTGKSTLIRQIIASLLTNTPVTSIMYFSFDEPTVREEKDTLEKLITVYIQNILRKQIHEIDETCYIFLDEIQLVPYWQDILKRYYDLNWHLKFVLTGSSSLFLRTKSKESLAGRIFEKQLSPLSFVEYQILSPKGSFEDYLDFGGFPELLELNDLSKKREYLKYWIIGKILEVDLPNLGGIRLVADFERLFWSLLPNTGQIIRFPKLGTDLGIKRNTLFRYLSLLQGSLLINSVANIAGSFRSTSRTLRKLYPASSNFLALSPTESTRGAQAETYVAQTLINKFGAVNLYNKRGQEVDFVLPEQKLAIEVKYQNTIHKEDYKFLIQFAKEKNYQPLLVTKYPVVEPLPVPTVELSRLEKYIK
ncbi:MAG: ATP-binding protein [Candidatus Amesbacteria bacterium]|nr:ATP-binding protein [Candidatus Amesbacteria bacterium]